VPQAPSDLLQHECIALESQLADGLWKFKTANGVTVATPRMTSSDILVVREMVMAGLGCGILTHALSEQDVRAGRLVRVLPNWRIPAIPVLAMFLERRHMPQRVRALIDIFAQAIKVQSA
jgi:DNA-binding transcriptional LysR family regulator